METQNNNNYLEVRIDECEDVPIKVSPTNTGMPTNVYPMEFVSKSWNREV